MNTSSVVLSFQIPGFTPSLEEEPSSTQHRVHRVALPAGIGICEREAKRCAMAKPVFGVRSVSSLPPTRSPARGRLGTFLWRNVLFPGAFSSHSAEVLVCRAAQRGLGAAGRCWQLLPCEGAVTP